MALFYQINFTSELHARRRVGLWCAIVLFVCLVVGASCFAVYLYEESKQPVLAPRLDTYQTDVTQITQTLVEWRQAETRWREISTYVEQEGQLVPADMLRSLEGLAQMGEQRAEEIKCPLSFLPQRLEVRRAGGIVLTGDAGLPERDKAEHCSSLSALVAGCLTGTVASVTNAVTAEVFPLVPRTFKFDWAKAVPGPDDARLAATLTATFADGKPLIFKSPPAELEGLLGESKKWHEKIFKVSVEVKPGKQETVDVLLNRVLSDNKQALGESFARIKALADTAVNPTAVSREIQKVLGEKASHSLDDFERAWNSVAQERWPWRRLKELDNPALDADIANMGAWLAGGVLPRKQVFETVQSKSLAYLNAMTNGVQSKHIEQEKTFWEVVLKPCFTVRTGLVPGEALKAALDARDKAARVAFPAWRVSLGVAKETSDKPGSGLTWADLGKVLMNVETNPAGMWVTAVSIEFDKTASDSKSRWDQLSTVTVEGRVPCWVGAGGKSQ